MKLPIQLSGLLLVLSGLLVYGENSDVTSYQDTSYDLILVTLEHGLVSLYRCPIVRKCSENQKIFSLDLSDPLEGYDTVLCNAETQGLLVVRSHNVAISDYCFNWGAMFGVDIAQSLIMQPVSVIVGSTIAGNPCVKISGMVNNRSFDLEIVNDCPVKSACACLLPTHIVDSLHVTSKTMSLSEGCRQGLVIAKNRDAVFIDPDIEREIEFENIIDSMVQDGIIKVKPVSPFMAKLHTFGSHIFVQYLALKNAIRNFWNSWWHAHEGQNNTQSIMREHYCDA